MKSKTGKDLETTPVQNVIYSLLVNPINPKFPRTQNEVCNLLAMSKSTVHDNVRKLIEKGFLKEVVTPGKIKYYRGGKYRKLIEMRIPIDNLAYGAQFGEDGQAITPYHLAEPSGQASYRPLWRTHLNGGWLMFHVTEEGYLDRISHTPDGKPVEQILFGDVDPYHLKGSLNWPGAIIFEGNALELRYQRTSSGKKFFYIIPDNNICTAAAATPDDDLITPFMRSCRPILQWLEKYGSWKFRRKESGDYECVANINKALNKGIHKEYGADEFITELFDDYVGKDVGIIGVDPYHRDKSPRAQGRLGEWEFSQFDYVQAVDSLPDTKRKADAAASREDLMRVASELRGDMIVVLRMLMDALGVALPIRSVDQKEAEA